MKILKSETVKSGKLYDLKKELWQFGSSEFDATEMLAAYNKNGDYIGNENDAKHLCDKRGIAPEKSAPNHNVCCIGKSEIDGKWYGWSHRAIYGFEVGSQVKKGDCAYLPSNREEYIETLKDWYTDDMYKNVNITVSDNGIVIDYDIIQEGTGKVMHSTHTEPLDIQYGNGEWTAKTEEDAKQMAIAFAESVG